MPKYANTSPIDLTTSGGTHHSLGEVLRRAGPARDPFDADPALVAFPDGQTEAKRIASGISPATPGGSAHYLPAKALRSGR